MGATDWQVIGIDLGGTAIKLGRFNACGDCLQDLTVPTPQPATPTAVADAMAQAVAVVDPHREAKAIGLGTPGPADAAGRVAPSGYQPGRLARCAHCRLAGGKKPDYPPWSPTMPTAPVWEKCG